MHLSWAVSTAVTPTQAPEGSSAEVRLMMLLSFKGLYTV